MSAVTARLCPQWLSSVQSVPEMSTSSRLLACSWRGLCSSISPSPCSCESSCRCSPPPPRSALRPHGAISIERVWLCPPISIRARPLTSRPRGAVAAVGITVCQGDRGSATIGDDSSFIMAEVSVPLNGTHSPAQTQSGSLN